MKLKTKKKITFNSNNCSPKLFFKKIKRYLYNLFEQLGNFMHNTHSIKASGFMKSIS